MVKSNRFISDDGRKFDETNLFFPQLASVAEPSYLLPRSSRLCSSKKKPRRSLKAPGASLLDSLVISELFDFPLRLR